jgi:2Fe-2S ferredoxin
MPVTFKTHDGAQGAEGLPGDCGGGCSHATCHVVIDLAWHAALPPIGEMEEEMLGCTAEPR